MPPEDRQVKLFVRLDDIIAPVHVGLKALMLLVADSLGRASTPVEVPEDIPRVFFRFDPAPGLRPSRDELTSYVEQRIFHWAMSDAVELVKPLIVRCRAMCALYDRGPSFVMTGDQWNAMQEDWKRSDAQMARMSLPRRLEEFSRRHPDFKTPPLLPEIQGIFGMRNCLVHNDGVVVPSYCNEPTGLRIRFRRYSAWVLDSTGDHEYIEDEIVRHGQSLQMRFVTAERAWQIGERIVLSPQLFVDLCVTIDRFAFEMIHALEAYGRLKGIAFEPSNPEKTQGNAPRQANLGDAPQNLEK